MTILRTAAQQALETFKTIRCDALYEQDCNVCNSEEALRDALAEPVQEPVAWTGYDLDEMVEAFSRVIEAHHHKANPFHNPIDMDAKMALRILRGFIPAMKAYATPLQRKPLTEEEIAKCWHDTPWNADLKTRVFAFARAVEAAHGIKEGT